MNLILLFDEDFIAPGRVRLHGRRLAHLRLVHRAVVGDRVRVGRLNGRLGDALISKLDEQGAELEPRLGRPPPTRPDLVLVMGLPRHMHGEESAAADEVRALGEGVAALTRVAVEYIDERLTTVIAQRVLAETNMSGAKKREVVDKLAATIILQTWLDRKNKK